MQPESSIVYWGELHTSTALQDVCMSSTTIPYTKNERADTKFADTLKHKSSSNPHYLTPRRWIYWMWLQTTTDKGWLLTDGTIINKNKEEEEEEEEEEEKEDVYRRSCKICSL